MVKFIFSSCHCSSLYCRLYVYWFDSDSNKYLICLFAYIRVNHKKFMFHANLAAGVTGGLTSLSSDRMWWVKQFPFPLCAFIMFYISAFFPMLHSTIILSLPLLTTGIRWASFLFCFLFCSLCYFSEPNVNIILFHICEINSWLDGSCHICICCTIVAVQSFLLLLVHAAGRRTEKRI